MNRLQVMYQNEIMPAMIKKFGYKNNLAVPKIDKIILNIGMGENKDMSKALDSASNDIAAITGQKPVITKAKNLSPLLNFVPVCLSVAK